MLTYYNRLAESLESKYSLNLNEAWGSSPSWMHGALARGLQSRDKIEDSKVYKRAYADAINAGDDQYTADHKALVAWERAKGTTSRDYADYGSVRGNGYVRPSEKTLAAQFKANGIDITDPNLEFIEGDFPKSKNDPRIQPPNIGIWHIPSTVQGHDQVYAKGINDLEKPFNTVGDMGAYKNLQFKDISLKKLSEVSDAFCYIDGSSIVQKDFKTIETTRKDNTNQKIQRMIGGQERVPEEERSHFPFFDKEFDKSGYIKIPAVLKYAEILEERKLKKWADMLNHTHDVLEKCFSEYQKTVMSWDYAQVTYRTRQASNRFLNYFEDASSYLESVIRIVDKASETYAQDTAEFYKYLKNGSFFEILKAAEGSAERARQSISDIILTDIDF